MVRATSRVLSCLLLALLFGGPSLAAGDEVAKISGVVTVDGVPLDKGTITFFAADGQFFGCKIAAGKYKIDQAWTGEWTVTIDTVKKFASAESSPLRASVRSGNNVFDFSLGK